MKNQEEIAINNEKEIDEELLRIYEKNMAKIIGISKWIQIYKITAIISFVLFLIILALKLGLNFSWFFLLIPSLTTMITYTLYLNNYLKLKDIFDEETALAQEKNQDNSSHIGSVLSYLCLNLSVLCLTVYLILLSAKLENMLNTSFNMIGIPFYIMLAVFIFYSIFIMPAFISNNLIAEILLIFLFVIGGSVYFILLNLKLDKNINIVYLLVFSPLIFVLTFYIGYSIFNFTKTWNTPQSQKFGDFFFAISVLIASVLISLKLDNHIKIKDWVMVLIIIFGSIFIVFDNFSNLFSKDNESEEGNNKI